MAIKVKTKIKPLLKSVLTIVMLLALSSSFILSNGKNLAVEANTSFRNTDPGLFYTGWLPVWAGEDGYRSLEVNRKRLGSVSPVWYEINEDGSLKSKIPTNARQITKLVRDNDIALVPTIATFDHNLLHGIFQDQDNLNRHINDILDQVERNQYDGIDLDYESTLLEDKEKYFEFLKALSEKLHAKNKTLVVTVISKWGDDISYGFLPQTREVQDWSEIAKYADEIRIMAYDYTYQRSAAPGPIGPLSWQKRILDYAVTEIPRNKIVLGVHLYSYEWRRNLNDNEPFQIPASSYTYRKILEIKSKYPGEETVRESENFYKYQIRDTETNEMQERILVYMSPAGVKAREDLAKEYDIKGLAFWRFGGDAY